MPAIRSSAISESGIVFFSAGGHIHDGINSSIIDTSKYSIFDFGFGLVGTNPDRINLQTINQTAFKDFIVKSVNESVLEPAGVVLQDNIINSRNIIAGSITAIEIAANTITANNIAAGTITSNEIAANTITGNNIAAGTITASDIAANTITGNNIAASTITSTNIAAGTITGNNIAANTITGNNIAANTITGDRIVAGQIAAGSVTILYSNGVATGDYWSNVGSFRLGGTAGINYTAGGTITFGSNIAINGSISSTGTITGGNISGVKLTGSTGDIGGWDILSTKLQSATNSTSLYSNGTIEGNLFRTGATGGRIEMGPGAGTSDELYFYSATPSTNRATLRNPSPGSQLRVSTTGNVFDFLSNRFACGATASFAGPIYATSSAYTMGNSTNLWGQIYSTSATINTSDGRLKTDIKDVPVGLDFVEEMRPVSYKWKKVALPNSSEEIREAMENNTDPPERFREGIREHYGLISQDIKGLMDKYGIEDFAGWCLADPNDPNSNQMLGYTEFIPILIKAIQELSAKVDALEAKI